MCPSLAQAEDEPVNVLFNTFHILVPPERGLDNGQHVPSNFEAERDTLAAWIQNEAWRFGFNRTLYALDRDFFEKVSPTDPCHVSCGGIWPSPPLQPSLNFDFGSEHESWLVDVGPFRGQTNPFYDTVRTWLRLGRLTDVFDRRICREDQFQEGLLAGESSGCTCKFTYGEVLGYLREQVQHIRDEANALEPGLFEKIVRGMHFNFESYAFPRLEYEEAPGGPVRFQALPGVCLATGEVFNRTDFDGDLDPDHNAGTNGAMHGAPPLSLDAFLRDVEFDYPALMLTSAGGPSGQVAFGDTGSGRWGISQSFVITNDYVSRVDVKLSRISSTGYPPGYIYYTLAEADTDGKPLLQSGSYTTPRGTRAWWVPHVGESQRGWISFYIDPQESHDLFDATDRVAFVLFLINTQPGDGYTLDRGPSVSGCSSKCAYLVNTGGSGPSNLSLASAQGVDDLEHRVWYATRTDRSAHDDWVTFQNRRVGDVLRDVNVRAFGKDDGFAEDGGPGAPSIELWPFAHVPDRQFAGMSAQELWGSDLGENHNGIGSAAQIDGIQSGYIGNISHAQSLYSGGTKPASYQVTDVKDEPDYDPATVQYATRWAFALGGLSVFSRGFAPINASDHDDWQESQLPKLHAFTAPRRLFPEHYQWVQGGPLPDATEGGGLFTLSALCPIYPDGPAGHVLVANTSSTSKTIDLIDHVPPGWRTVLGSGPMNVDVATVYHQQKFDHYLVPHLEHVLCDSDEDVTYTLDEFGNDDFGSLVIARYHTPLVQPGRFTSNKPGGEYCTDHTMTVKWNPIPEACIEQRGFALDGVRVSIDFEVFTPTEEDPVPHWRHLYRPVSDSADDGEEDIDICGPYPPTTSCPTEHYGKNWRAKLTFCSPVCSQYYSEPIFSTYSSTFKVFPEYEGACNAAGGCPYVGAATADGHAMDNNVLAYSGDGTPVVDHYRLRIEPALLDSIYHLTLSETAADVSVIDSVSILIVDHPESTHVAVAHDGAIHGFTGVRPPSRALASDGSNVTALVAVEGDTLDYHGYAADHVTLDLGVADSTSALYVVSDIKLVPYPAPLSILVQVPDPTTDWTTVRRLEPRDLWGEDVLPLSVLGYAAGDSVRIRLLWTAEHKVDFVGLLSGTAVWSVSEVPVGWAYHTTLGDVTASLRGDDLDQVTLASGEVMLMEFPADTIAAGDVRDVVLVTDGLWTGPGGVPARQSQRSAVTRPALSVAGPRPARGAVTMQIVLPDEADVAVRIFDVQGRSVRTVSEGRRLAGRHLAVWDLRDDRNGLLGAGVFFARLEVDGAAVSAEKLHVVR